MKPNTGTAVCERCVEKAERRPTWKCFHVNILSEEETKKYEATFAELTQLWSHNMEPVHAYRILKLAAPENANFSVDFVPNSLEESLNSVLILRNEMRLRGKRASNNSLNQLQTELRECL